MERIFLISKAIGSHSVKPIINIGLVLCRLKHVSILKYTADQCHANISTCSPNKIGRHCIIQYRLSSSTPKLKASKDWYTITFIKSDTAQVTVKGKDGDSLLDIVNNNNIDLEGYGACEGTLACSTCHVIFDKKDYDKIPPPADEELDMLDLAFELTDTEIVKCISFAGSGFLGLYLIGAAQYIQDKYPKAMSSMEYAGSSAGAVIACGLACGVPLARAQLAFLNAAAHARTSVMGPFASGFSIQDHLRKGLENLPSDAHFRANGRLHISVTKASDLSNRIFSHWNSRDELIKTVMCSCFIPGISGIRFLKLKGVDYIDGGFSNRLPIIHSNTLTVSPFFGAAHISPRKMEANHSKLKELGSLYRYFRTLIPLAPHDMMTYFAEGYADSRRYFEKRKQN